VRSKGRGGSRFAAAVARGARVFPSTNSPRFVTRPAMINGAPGVVHGRGREGPIHTRRGFHRSPARRSSPSDLIFFSRTDPIRTRIAEARTGPSLELIGPPTRCAAAAGLPHRLRGLEQTVLQASWGPMPGTLSPECWLQVVDPRFGLCGGHGLTGGAPCGQAGSDV